MHDVLQNHNVRNPGYSIQYTVVLFISSVYSVQISQQLEEIQTTRFAEVFAVRIKVNVPGVGHVPVIGHRYQLSLKLSFLSIIMALIYFINNP